MTTKPLPPNTRAAYLTVLRDLEARRAAAWTDLVATKPNGPDQAQMDRSSTYGLLMLAVVGITHVLDVDDLTHATKARP